MQARDQIQIFIKLLMALLMAWQPGMEALHLIRVICREPKPLRFQMEHILKILH